MIEGSSAYKLVDYDYKDEVDPISGAPTLVAVPRTVTIVAISGLHVVAPLNIAS